MANVKITELPDVEEVSGADVLPIVDVSGSVTSKVTFTDLRAAVLDGVSGAEEWSEHAATQDVDMDGHKITNLGAPTDAADAATKQYVDTVAGAAPTKIENGTASLEVTPGDGGSSIARLVRNGFEYLLLNDEWFNSGSGWFGRRTLPASTPSPASHSWFEFSNSHALMRSNSPGISSFGAVRVDTANGGNVYFDIPGASAGGGYASSRGIRLGSDISHTPNIRALPPGANSILHAIKVGWDGAQAVAAATPQPETLSWSGVTNVASVSHVEASIKEEGGYVDIDAAVLVTPVAAGITRASAVLSGLAPQTPRAGTASASDNATVAPASCGAVPSGGDAELTVMFDAQSTDPHMVSVRIRYEAA